MSDHDELTDAELRAALEEGRLRVVDRQVTAAELAKMTPEQALQADQEGRLHDLLTGEAST